MITLFDYFRSTASYRVRIALHYKGLPFKQRSVHLVRDGGEQHKADYRALNPQGLVPTLIDDSDASAEPFVLNQSLAILEYLEELHPSPALLPGAPAKKATARALAQLIACDIHPLNNLRVLKYLTGTLHVDDTQKTAWYHHWLNEGFNALEKMLNQQTPHTSPFCCGDEVTFADVCLIPQLYNAKRFDFPLDAFPTLQRIDDHCNTLPAFQAAHPDNQPDAA